MGDVLRPMRPAWAGDLRASSTGGLDFDRDSRSGPPTTRRYRRIGPGSSSRPMPLRTRAGVRFGAMTAQHRPANRSWPTRTCSTGRSPLAVAALSLVAVFAGAPDVGPAGIVNLVLLLLQALPLAVPSAVAARGRARRARRDAGPARDPAAGRRAAVEPRPARRPLHRRRAARAAAGDRHPRRLRHCARGVGAPARRPAGWTASVIQTEIFFVVAWFVGDAARIRRLYARSLRDERARLLEARARGGEPAGGRRGAGADRPRAARRGDAPRQRDRHPGRRRAARARDAAGGGARRARGDRRHRSPGADRHAPHARHPRRGREPGADARARPAWTTSSSRCALAGLRRRAVGRG